MSEAPKNSRLFTDLVRLANECAHDDAIATKGPWIWTDETFLWNPEIDRGVLQHGDVAWPVAPENREVIAAARNRLPELAAVLKEAAADHAHMVRMYKESRDYVGAILRERDDLVEAMQRHVAEANRQDARIEQLKKALAEALDIAQWEASEYMGKPEHLKRIPELRGVLEGDS